MLVQKNRLKTLDFDKVFNFGKKAATKDVFVKYLDNDLTYPRFAVAVSKKNVSSAVKRHLLKRKFFNAIRKSVLMKTNRDYIFLPDKELLDKKEKEIILIIEKIRLQ